MIMVTLYYLYNYNKCDIILIDDKGITAVVSDTSMNGGVAYGIYRRITSGADKGKPYRSFYIEKVKIIT